MNQPIIIAGTGHRPVKTGGYSFEAQQALQKLIIDYLTSTYSKEELTNVILISGMAQGWDQAMAWAAVKLKIPFYAYIPFKGQEKVWPAEARNTYHFLLATADKLIFCSEAGYSALKLQIRNQRMVDDCTYLLAYYDGSPGGTRNCIDYANIRNKKVINLKK